ncbi:MAG TPA: hypothetical protein VMS88_01740, partial [Terriglobales bacterium]|nr:hypothetical protein [Terriglobales bacterium]
VCALALSGSTVYAGGYFTSIGGQARNCIAALDATTGAATAWNPNAGGQHPYVLALAVSESTVYAGGEFTSIGGQARNFIAALDATAGAATAWNPNANGLWVSALAVSGSTVYAGGAFTSIGGQVRNRIAALDATTGGATDWDPNVESPDPFTSVYALVVSGSTVYAGGEFTSIGGQARNGIAALDATTGAARAWNPNAWGSFDSDLYTTVGALAVSGSTVYAGGNFTAMGGQAQSGIAAVGDISTGTLLTRFDAEVESDGVLLRWEFSRPVHSVTVERAENESGPWNLLALEERNEEGMTVALDRTTLAGKSYWYQLLAQFNDGTQITFGPVRAEVPAPILASGLTRLSPNPCRGATRIEYAVAHCEKVRLLVLDVAGREIEVLVNGDMAPGRYSALWDGRRGRTPLASGLYFLRWESPGRLMTKRVALVR